eukprot:gb/GEZN01003122.1/.p1 GENE.gb/GEZN01003122.1/~~gb/GEZN01003122.1/.p1  ORF type:complete len:553 (+),score=60.84 gb/GEZN01003122.1/:88-1659(+)
MLYCVGLLLLLAGYVSALVQEEEEEEALESRGDLSLYKLLVFSRHGIRVPYQPPGGAESYSREGSGRNWFLNPQLWGAKGEAYLTDHGYKVISLMGDYMSSLLVGDNNQRVSGSAALLNSSCGTGGLGDITIYADFDDTGRDIATAQAFFQGMYPKCGVPVIESNPAYVGPIFNTGNLAPNKLSQCNIPSQLEVEGTFGGDASYLSDTLFLLLEPLGASTDCCQPQLCNGSLQLHRNRPFLRPASTQAKSSGEARHSQSQRYQRFKDRTGNFRRNARKTSLELKGCELTDIPTQWLGLPYQYYNGPLWSASSVVEYLQLEYLNGLDYRATTDLSPLELFTFMDAHVLDLNVQENMYATRAFGSQLLAHIIGTMDSLLLNQSASWIKSKHTDQIVYYAGHDINLYFLRKLMELNWLTESFNLNQAPPGAMLLFEMHKDASGDFFVKLFFQTASMDQQRYSEPLSRENPPDKVLVSIPRCSFGPDASCPYVIFRNLALAALDPECLQKEAQQHLKRWPTSTPVIY